MNLKRLLSTLAGWSGQLNKSQSNDITSCDSMSDISKTEDKRHKDSSILIIKVTNICARGRQPEDILSNLCGNDFCFEDVQCGCMESFLQSLKFQDEQPQREICHNKADELDGYSIPDWKDSQPLWWKGCQMNRHSSEYIDFLSKAYMDLYLWSHRFRDALMVTEGKQLIYNSGKIDPCKAVLTDAEFCKILTNLRENKKKIIRNTRIHVDGQTHMEWRKIMTGVIVL